MRFRSRHIALALGAAVSLALVGAQTAHAQERCVAPPGMAGIEQYCEVIPGAGGDRPTSQSGSGRVGGEVSGSTRQTLEDSGAAGSAVLNLPAGVNRGERRQDRAGGPAEPASSSGGSNGVADAIATSAGEAASGTPVVVWVLLAIGALFAAAVWTRARSSSEPGA